ncbi:MAG TPA: TetR family transcriptional regulator, partial [Propionibacteriaceae bacterium]|nr:TetR family transcriptional regulator [Propionibacteriaceae bacterium]
SCTHTPIRLHQDVAAGDDKPVDAPDSRPSRNGATAVSALAQLGARDPVAAGSALAACSEGLLLHNIARHDDTDPRPTFDLVVRAAHV